MLWCTARTWGLDTVTVTLSHCRAAVISGHQYNNWLEMKSHQQRFFSPWKHISLCKYWWSTWLLIFSKYAVFIYYNNNTLHSLFVFCFQTTYFIVFCPQFYLIPALYLKGFRQHLRYSLLSLNWNAFYLFVQNMVDKLLHLIYFAQVNNTCPLLVG